MPENQLPPKRISDNADSIAAHVPKTISESTPLITLPGSVASDSGLGSVVYLLDDQSIIRRMWGFMLSRIPSVRQDKLVIRGGSDDEINGFVDEIIRQEVGSKLLPRYFSCNCHRY